MGIDIYARWDDQTEEEKEAQYTGFSIVSGHVGYLREAYHGGPYATQVLMPEAFEDKAIENGGAVIPAATLRERLPTTLEAASVRSRTVYDEEPSSEVLKSFEDFVALIEQLESDGRNPRVYASY